MPEFKTSGTTHGKAAIKKLLISDDGTAIWRWLNEAHNPARVLISFLFDELPIVRWRAVETLGVAGEQIAESNIESVRRLVRRFFWMLNDESGNFCHMAPQALGEILRNVPQLIDEYAPMLPPFLIEEPFEAGTRIAISRIAEIRKDVFPQPTIKKLVQTLNDPDPTIRGTSIIALKALEAAFPEDKLKKLLDDKTSIEIYDFTAGSMAQVTIAQLTGIFKG